MKIAIILGTRPEIIKMSPIIRSLEKRDIDFFILHTGQHYSYNMDSIFFEQLNLPTSKYNLEVGSGTHAKQTGDILIGVEKILIDEKPDVVLVQGDTNSVLAGALAAAKLRINVGHVEAGLRSYDRCMPEELNRVLTDHCSDYLFAPTETSKQNLLREGIKESNINVVGNTIVEAVNQNLELSRSNEVLDKLELVKGDYFLGTIHRQENVDDPKRFSSIIHALELVSFKLGCPVVYPIHPRARNKIDEIGLKVNIKLIEPLDYLSFLVLEKNAKLVLTDSGGVQEESCILGVPCVTLRDNTERPETVEVGANIVAGVDPGNVLEKSRMMLNRMNKWMNPFGDGKTSKYILDIINIDYGNIK